MAPPKTDPLIGQLIGGCRVQSTLGRGGMGVVYRAVQERLRAPVALKVIKPEMGLNERAIARFEREAREIAKLRGETNHVVQIFDFGMDEAHGVYFISMELVDGEGVDSLVRRHGGLQEAQAIELTHQAALGLEVAREHGMVHRDIKPENLLLNKKGVLKITDFGLAKGLDDQSQQMTADGQALGTPAYMSPEQAEAMDLDHRSDIYSLGATLYSLVTGSTPYKADSAVTMALQHITAPVPDALEAGYEVSPELNQVIKKSMAKSAAGRFQTAGEMAKSLKAILDARQHGGASPQQTLSLMVQPPADDTMFVIEEDSGRATPVAEREPTGDTLAAADVTAMEFQGRATPTPTPRTTPAPALEPTIPDVARKPTPARAPRSAAPWMVGFLVLLLLAAGGVWWLTRNAGGGAAPPGPSPGPPPPSKKMVLGTPDEPEEGALLADGAVRVKGRLQATMDGGWVRVNGAPADVRRDRYDATLTLPDGAHAIAVTAGVGATEQDRLTVNVVVDSTAPVIEWAAPADGAVLAAAAVPVHGRVVESNVRACTLNGAPLALTGGAFDTTVERPDGRHPLTIVVEDRTGHRAEVVRRVVVDTTPPRLTLRGEGGQTTERPDFTLVGLVEDGTEVTVTVNGERATVRNGNLAHPVTLVPGAQTLTVRAEDLAGHVAEASVEVTYAPLPEGLVVGAAAGLYAWRADGAPMVAYPAGATRTFVDREEVTVARYAAFLQAAGADGATHVPRDWARQSAAGNAQRPVVGVAWASAQAYATWAGKDLPTVAEWLAAAGGAERAYPWGDAAPRPALCVFDREPALGRQGRGLDPVGAHAGGAAPSGCVDLAGNAAEWTADPGATPATRVVKGGSWTDPAEACRNDAAREVAETARLYTVGFRCVVRATK